MSEQRAARVSIVTAAAVEPVTLTEAKAHLRVVSTTDDTYIASCIVAAREAIETLTQRALIQRTVKAVWDRFPLGRTIRLPKGKVQSITSIQYYAFGATALATLDSIIYREDLSSTPARIIRKYGHSWPTEWDDGDALQIQYVAGYGAAGTSVPGTLKQAILMLVAHFYVARQPFISGTNVNELPKCVEYLALPYRVWLC